MSFQEAEDFENSYNNVNQADDFDNQSITRKRGDENKKVLPGDSYYQQNEFGRNFAIDEYCDFQNESFQNYPKFEEEESTNMRYQSLEPLQPADDYQSQIEEVPQRVCRKTNVKMFFMPQTAVEIKQPGETKNLPKGYARGLTLFINQIIKNSTQEEGKQVLSNPSLKSFLKLNPEKIGRKKVMDFLQTDIGKLFGKEFFGNCRWSLSLTKENKTNVDTYFRHNITYFEESVCPTRKQVKM